MGFVALIAFLILQRLTELIVAKKNEKWLLKQGAVEYGQRHYPFIVAMHTLFIISLIVEYTIIQPVINPLFLVLYVVLILLKIWTISSLGSFWNTKILRIPGMLPVSKGPYRYVKHPNYILVIGEIAVIPLIFNLYFTALIFSALNAIMLSIRIREENMVWKVNNG